MKKIAWENWNEKEKDLIEMSSIDSLVGDMNEEVDENQLAQMENMLGPIIGDFRASVIQTPFGSVPADSILKPSDRWDCWMGFTNFDLTIKVSDRIKIIHGVEALKIMSRYTFCVGVGKMFNFSSVRKDIENAVCK